MGKMTISQGLRLIKKLKGEIAELTARATQSVSYDEKSPPVYDYDEVSKERDDTILKMVMVEGEVAKANATKTITDPSTKKPITLALAIRILQEMKGQIAFLKSLAIKEGKETKKEREWDEDEGKTLLKTTETVWITKLKVKDRDNKMKNLKDQFDALNNEVERANHITTIDFDE